MAVFTRARVALLVACTALVGCAASEADEEDTDAADRQESGEQVEARVEGDQVLGVQRVHSCRRAAAYTCE
jgi:hypothetical protein